MALNAQAGAFNITTGAVSSQISVSGLGFTPTVVFFWWGGETSATNSEGSSDVQAGFGVMTGSSNRWALSSYTEDGVTTSNCSRRQTSAGCIMEILDDGSEDGRADFYEFNSDGFKVVIDAQFTTNLRVSYLALDIPNVTTGYFDPTGTGTLNVTGLGFQPECVLFGSSFRINENDGGEADYTIGLGAADGTREWSFSWAENDALGTTLAARYGVTDECLGNPNTATANMSQRGNFVQFTSTGFDVNIISNDGTVVWFVAMAGCGFHVKDFDTSTGTSNFDVGTGGVDPVAALFVSHNIAENPGVGMYAHMSCSIGAATGASERTVQAVAALYNVTTTVCYAAYRDDAVYMAPDGADSHYGRMDLVSFGLEKMTLVMDDADPSNYLCGLIAFGDAVDNPPGEIVTHYYNDIE